MGGPILVNSFIFFVFSLFFVLAVPAASRDFEFIKLIIDGCQDGGLFWFGGCTCVFWGFGKQQARAKALGK